MGLTERINQTTKCTYYEGAIPIEHVYTYGLALEEFFRSVKDKGKFLASTCPECGFTYLPNRIFCERCYVDIPKNQEVPGTGSVYAWTVVHLNTDESRKKEPVIAALIAMNETDSLMLGYLLKVKPEEVFVGLYVKPVFKPKKDRIGHIDDIVGFEPADPGGTNG
jgi:hypothetical protein